MMMKKNMDKMWKSDIITTQPVFIYWLFFTLSSPWYQSIWRKWSIWHDVRNWNWHKRKNLHEFDSCSRSLQACIVINFCIQCIYSHQHSNYFWGSISSHIPLEYSLRDLLCPPPRKSWMCHYLHSQIQLEASQKEETAPLLGITWH